MYVNPPLLALGVSSHADAPNLQMYINEDAEGNGGIERMKNAVWVDLVSALLWLVATVTSAGYWWKHRDVRTRFTGRAHV